MLLVTLPLIVAVPLVLERLAQRQAPVLWRPLRWSLLPPVGALVGALVPLGVLPFAPFMDTLLSLALGALMATLVAVHGLFSELCFSGPSEADVARSGRRSAYHGPVRV